MIKAKKGHLVRKAIGWYALLLLMTNLGWWFIWFAHTAAFGPASFWLDVATLVVSMLMTIVFLSLALLSSSQHTTTMNQILLKGELLANPVAILEWRHSKNKISRMGTVDYDDYGDYYYLYLKNGDKAETDAEKFGKSKALGYIWVLTDLQQKIKFDAFLDSGEKLVF
jgi:hypothetical protein